MRPRIDDGIIQSSDSLIHLPCDESDIWKYEATELLILKVVSKYELVI